MCIRDSRDDEINRHVFYTPLSSQQRSVIEITEALA